MTNKQINGITGLTIKEQECMDNIVNAWNIFTTLDKQHPNETKDFADSIHRIQGLFTTRMARRLYPEGWPTYNSIKNVKENHGTD